MKTKSLLNRKLQLAFGSAILVLLAVGAGSYRSLVMSEEAMREREKSFSTLANNISQLAWMADEKGYIAKGGVDITLLDMGLPDGHGLETVRRAHAAAPGVPLIILTGLDDEALAAEAMTQGAQDYMIKGQIESRALPPGSSPCH